MPIYEYECKQCGERFELRRTISASNKEAECPACKSKNTRKIFLPFSLPHSAGHCSSTSSSPT